METIKRKNKTHVELIGVALANSLTLVPKLIEEEEPSETILADESRETEERKGSKKERDAWIGQLFCFI